MSLEKITLKYKKKGKEIRGMMLMLQSRDALKFVTDCQKENLDLLGVEGFKVSGSKIQPFQEHSNDIADTNMSQEEFYEETKKFIQNRMDEDLWFEVVAGEKEN